VFNSLLSALQIIWKEAIQCKYKRERRPNMANINILMNKLKYSRPTSGRPVKKKVAEVAERDKHKQVSLALLFLFKNLYAQF
jgi:hypothetical protein